MKKISNLFIAAVLLAASGVYGQPLPPAFVANTRDSLALVDLYNSTNGVAWGAGTNWLTKTPLYKWTNLLFYTELYPKYTTIDRVTGLKFLYSGVLNGVIPASLGNLDSLQLLYFDQNNLSGGIPTTLGNLTILKSMELEKNNLSGNIPSSLGNLSKLVTLWLQNNQLSGSIPPSLGNLTKLTQIFLQYNQLSGSIPDSLGNMSNLNQLTAQYNRLSGSIPPTLGNMTNLIYLELNNNNLSGSIPLSLGNLTNLKTLALQNNKFTFNGLENIAKKFSFATYAPQAIVPLQQYGNTLSVAVGGTPANNTFKWYRNDTLVATTTSDSTYTVTRVGKYWMAATNAIATKLTLQSDTINITILPIKDIALSAKETNGQVQLQWQTIGEVNTATFTIQYSTNGSSFTDIGSVKAIGSGANGYQFTDNNPTTYPLNGVLYYRLKIVDKDGSFSYSKVVSVQLTVDRLPLTVAPNPAKDKVTVMGSNIVSVQVVDNMGKVIKTIALKDATNPTLSVGGLSAGVYHLRVQTTDGKVNIVGFVRE